MYAFPFILSGSGDRQPDGGGDEGRVSFVHLLLVVGLVHPSEDAETKNLKDSSPPVGLLNENESSTVQCDLISLAVIPNKCKIYNYSTFLSNRDMILLTIYFIFIHVSVLFGRVYQLLVLSINSHV